MRGGGGKSENVGSLQTSMVFRHLPTFDDLTDVAMRVEGRAFIPAPNEHLQTLGQVNEDFLPFVQRKSPQQEVMPDQHTSLVETY